MASREETKSSAPSAAKATDKQIAASDSNREPNRNTLEEQRAAESGSTVTISYSGDKRARVLRQALMPGGEWSGGEELVNRVEEDVEQSLSPGQRLVIEEIG